MGSYIVRRIVTGVVTLFFISIVIFLLLDLAPGDPTANLPLSVPQPVREQIRETLGINEPFHVRYLLWLRQFFWIEPLSALETLTGAHFPFLEGELRITSWTSRGIPVIDILMQRLPQTLWVVGLSYLLAVLIAVPLGVLAAWRQNSVFDHLSSIFTVIGFSLPTFFTGILVIQIFAVWLGWFPTLYNTTLRIDGWATLGQQLRQMTMPVLVLTFFQTAAISRFTRASVIDHLKLDYIRTARAKGLSERRVLVRHAVRNSLIPVVTLIALGIPGIFGGAIVTEQIFAVNGIGQYLISSLQSSDIPAVQTVLILYAVLVVTFNIVADLLYGWLDPRIRYS